jgi:hypothetical protein
MDAAGAFAVLPDPEAADDGAAPADVHAPTATADARATAATEAW